MLFTSGLNDKYNWHNVQVNIYRTYLKMIFTNMVSMQTPQMYSFIQQQNLVSNEGKKSVLP